LKGGKGSGNYREGLDQERREGGNLSKVQREDSMRGSLYVAMDGLNNHNVTRGDRKKRDKERGGEVSNEITKRGRDSKKNGSNESSEYLNMGEKI